MASIKLDFQIYDNRDLFRFYLIDTSVWKNIENKPAIVEITPPNFKEPVVSYFDKNTMNVVNSDTLGIACSDCDDIVELSDGIYNITLKGSPDNFFSDKTHLRTTKLKLMIDKLMVEKTLKGMCKNDCNIEDIVKYDILLRSAEAHNRYGNPCAAMEIYNDVYRDVSRNMDCKNCK